METIPIADCEKIGYIKKTHGVQGDVVLEFENEYEFAVEDANCFFIELDGLLVPFFIEEEGFRFRTNDTAIVSLEAVNNEKYAKRLVGCGVYLLKDDVVGEIQADMDNRLIGYLLIDEKIGNVGLIEHVDDYAGNIVLTVNYRGEELLVPFNEDLVVEISHDKSRIIFNLPEGLIE